MEKRDRLTIYPGLPSLVLLMHLGFALKMFEKKFVWSANEGSQEGLCRTPGLVTTELLPANPEGRRERVVTWPRMR